MDTLRATYRSEEDDEITDPAPPIAAPTSPTANGGATTTGEPLIDNGVKAELPVRGEDNNFVSSDENEPKTSRKFTKISETTEDDDDEEDEEGEEEEDEPPSKKQKPLSLLTTPEAPNPNPRVQSEQNEVQQREAEAAASFPQLEITETPLATGTAKSASKTSGGKKYKKKNNNNVWTRPTSRKGKKKAKNFQSNGNHNNGNNNDNTSAQAEDRVLITPIPRFPDKNDDNPEMKICLSKFYKAEKVEISEDRLSAGSTKGYRMVRATRGVMQGAWYFEIKIAHLGETGHTRLGWSTEKGDLQAPVGFDPNSFGYRDIDGSKVHKALREKYGDEGYREGDVIGFYINLPEGGLYAPKPPRYVWYKGQRYVCAPDAREDPPKVVPGSEMCFFKNGICQGTAFKDLYGGRYYPAASMYTLPNQPNCVVRFNFGPDFDFFPEDFGERPAPRPMIEVPYHGLDGRVENGVSNEKKQ